ncbi:MAG: NFACT family protein [Clostridiales bacterium]|nr:NFACT family protein [Clostridiales bacterium]
MDGLSLSAVAYELRSLIGGRIEKVQQPEKDELILAIHTADGNTRLLLSASPENGRVCLTDEKKLSPVEAPAFLMLMRKYLTGGRIKSVDQPNMDRIIEFSIETYSELHDAVTVKLVCEIMGRHSNIILTDADGVIMDAIRRVSPSLSSARLILPKVIYEYPPSKKKEDPRLASPLDFASVIKDAVKTESALSDKYYGLSPAVAKKLVFSLGYPECGAEVLSERLAGFYSDFSKGRFKPCVVKANGSTVSLLPFIPNDGSEIKRFGTMSEAVCDYYSSRAYEESLKRRTAVFDRAITNAKQKLEKKLSIYSEAITSEEENEKYRLYGELLTANLYRIPQRIDQAVVTDYYSDPPVDIVIPLDPLLSASDNAQRYYTKYRKGKTARDHAVKMREEAVSELSYLEDLSYSLSCCDGESDLNEIRQELLAAGLLSDESKKSRRSAGQAKVPPSKPYSFVSRDGLTILVGKNNKQNDRLTLNIAAPEDVWLHVKDSHGSHVIIKRSSPIPDTTLYDAAMLAAYYSKARGSANVPVDYTQIKYVKKPSGAKPGMVIYTHQHTAYVTPDIEYVKSLMK